MRARKSRVPVGLVLAGLLVAFWGLLAPSQLGGPTTFTATVGNSMEPMFHKGDLALTRKSPAYRVGDIVLYESPVFHRPVLHRIIVIQHGHYFFKGDNNEFVDPGYVTHDELLGKLWLHVPNAGTALSWMGKPTHSAFFAGFAVLVLTLGGAKTTRRRRRGRRRSAAAKGPIVKNSTTSLTSLHRHLHRPRKSAENIGGGIAGLLAVVLLIVGFTSPVKKTVPLHGAYRHAGTFSYSARVIHPVSTYPTGIAHAGVPFFLNDFKTLDIGFTYRFASKLPHNVHGTISLKARVSTDSNWSTNYILRGTRRFRGDNASARGTLDLQSLRSLITQLSVDSGSVGGEYLVTLEPVVHVIGAVGGRKINETFSPELENSLTQAELKLTVPTGPVLPGASYAQPSAEAALTAALNPIKAGSSPGFAPAYVSFARYKLAVSAVRGLALGLAALALLVLFTKPLKRKREVWSHEKRIANRYECVIVDVVSVSDGATSNVATTEIPDFESLATLARYCERPILRETTKGVEAYAVEDGGRLYIHRPKPAPPAAALPVHVEPPRAEPVRIEPVALAPAAPLHALPALAEAALPPTKPSRRTKRRLFRPVAVLVVILVVATFATAFTAANTVPLSYAGTSLQASALAQMAPSQCAGITLTNLIAMTTNSTSGTTGNDLILGRNVSATVTLTAGGGDDCVVGGGGAGTTNKFDGGGGTNDVCIGAAGATNTFTHCEHIY
jgi:signal peptidase I